MDDHMNNYTKLLVELVNIDVTIEEDDKALILLNSLPDEEYTTFILALINDKQSLNCSDVSSTLMNQELTRKDKQCSSSSTTAEAMTTRGMGSNHRKGKVDFESPKLMIVKV